MALFRESQLGLNDEYKQMLEARKLMSEAITSNNSIHEETEKLINELSGDEITLNPDELEERLKDLEKKELTSLDKKVITNIRKNVASMQKAQEDFEKFTKGLKYEYVVSRKAGAESAEKALEGEDEKFEAPADEPGIGEEEVATPVDEFKPEDEPKTESKNIVDEYRKMLAENKSE